MARRKFSWTPFQRDKLDRVIEVLKELDEYKPLTLRQIHYQLVGKRYTENTVSAYNALSKLLKFARIDGYVSWDDIEDRVRAYHDLQGWNNKEEFIEDQTRWFLRGYRRDFLQSQDKYLEIWVEKDALSSIFTKIAREYSVPVVVCRGFNSVTFQNDFRKRARRQQELGKEVVLLYFGDFDPSGMEMLPTMKITLEDELGLSGVNFKHIALEKSDVQKYKLPYDMKALKLTDTRANKFIGQYGKIAVELDALRPDVLERKIKEAIQAEINEDKYLVELEKYQTEIDELAELKKEVGEMMKI